MDYDARVLREFQAKYPDAGIVARSEKEVYDVFKDTFKDVDLAMSELYDNPYKWVRTPFAEYRYCPER